MNRRASLPQLAAGLAPRGRLVLKENRPYLPGTDLARFQMDTPEGENARYDVTRPDAHHRLLFEHHHQEVWAPKEDDLFSRHGQSCLPRGHIDGPPR